MHSKVKTTYKAASNLSPVVSLTALRLTVFLQISTECTCPNYH